MSRLTVTTILLFLIAPPLTSQVSNGDLSVGLGLGDEVRVGRQVPAFVLPYATRDSVGPSDQPFDVRKELGHIVVLAFYPGDFTPGCVAEWRAFAAQADSLFGANVVVVGISADSLATHVRFARDLDLPFKLLSDTGHRVALRFGATDGDRPRRMVVVIGRDGIVRYVDPRFGALDPGSYVKLKAALDVARAEIR